jgi:lipopolysaccharide exporter
MKAGFLRNILTVGSGGAVAQALTVITMPIITRLYSPEAFAGWGLLISVVVLFTAIVTLRYELAIVLPASHEEAANGLTGSLIVIGIISLVATIILFFSWSLFLGGFHEELKLWLWFLPGLIAATGMYQVCYGWLTRTQEFGWYSFSQVALPCMTIGCQMGAAFLGFRDSFGLIAGTLLGQCGVVVILIYFIYRRYRKLFQRSVSAAGIRAFLWKYRVYPFYMTPYTIVSAVRDRLVYFLLATYGQKPDIGFYNLSSRLVSMPNSLLSSAVRPVFFQHATTTDFKLLETQINRVLNFLAICVVPFWILFLFHARDIFALVFGEPWREAGIYAAILSVPAVPLILGNWLDRAFDALGRQRLAFALELSFSLLSIGALTLGMLVSGSGLVAISLQATVLTFYYSYWLFVLFQVAGYRLQGLFRLFIFILGTAFLFALVSVFFASILSSLPAILCNAGVAMLAISGYFLREWKGMRRQAA